MRIKLVRMVKLVDQRDVGRLETARPLMRLPNPELDVVAYLHALDSGPGQRRVMAKNVRLGIIAPDERKSFFGINVTNATR